MREHLRACAHCRATLRAYRAAPRAAAALAPTLPLGRSLLDRAHEALTGLAARLGPGGDATVGGMASAGGSRGAGVAALAKIAALCVGTAGGAAACVAAGVVPAPLAPEPRQVKAAHVAKPLDRQAKREFVIETGVEYEPEAPVEAAPAPEAEAKPEHQAKATPTSASQEPAPPPEPEPATSSGAVEYEPPPAPAAVASGESSSSYTSSSSSSTASSGGGNPAGEFGP